jgi:hypothetical protein
VDAERVAVTGRVIASNACGKEAFAAKNAARPCVNARVLFGKFEN